MVLEIQSFTFVVKRTAQKVGDDTLYIRVPLQCDASFDQSTQNIFLAIFTNTDPLEVRGSGYGLVSLITQQRKFRMSRFGFSKNIDDLIVTFVRIAFFNFLVSSAFVLFPFAWNAAGFLIRAIMLFGLIFFSISGYVRPNSSLFSSGFPMVTSALLSYPSSRPDQCGCKTWRRWHQDVRLNQRKISEVWWLRHCNSCNSCKLVFMSSDDISTSIECRIPAAIRN